MLHKKILSVFDFDGTLTYRDSFIPFLYFAFSKRTFLVNLLKIFPFIAAYVVGGISRNRLKEVIITVYLKGIKVEWLQDKAEEFCKIFWGDMLRPLGIFSVSKEIKEGAIVTLCTASPELIIQPFSKRLKVGLIGTELESKKGILTGHIKGVNCRCAEKVTRLEKRYGDLKKYIVRAWGNSKGDRQMLTVAQESHWKPFH